MATTFLQDLKKRAGKLIEPAILKTGQVLEIRPWQSGTMTEIDLHLPGADMQYWREVPSIKFRVDDLTFRDYTPFGWDTATATCSLLIDTAHEGCGSSWAKHLRAGDRVQYLKIEGTKQSSHPTDLVVGLGDTSSLGHLLALRQLTLPVSRFDGAVLLDSLQTGQLFSDYFRSPLSTLAYREELADWLVRQGYCTEHTWFYLTGGHQLVSDWRRLLRSMGYQHIRVKGFWS